MVKSLNSDDDDDYNDSNDKRKMKMITKKKTQVCVASDEHGREIVELGLKNRQNLKNRLPPDLHCHQYCILVSVMVMVMMILIMQSTAVNNGGEFLTFQLKTNLFNRKRI